MTFFQILGWHNLEWFSKLSHLCHFSNTRLTQFRMNLFDELAQDLDDEASDGNSTETDSDNSEDEHNDTQLAVDLYQDQSDTEVLLQPTQPTTTPPPAPEPPKCQICLVGPLNAVWMCGHFLCVDCAENIKNNQSRVRRVCHLCRKKATSYIKCFLPWRLIKKLWQAINPQ